MWRRSLRPRRSGRAARRGGSGMPNNLQSQNYIRISATTLTPPSVRRHEAGSRQTHRRHADASAARPVSPPAWSGTIFAAASASSREPTTIRSISIQHVDLDAVHRMGQSQGRSRMADPQGRLHALRGPGLPQGLPCPRRDRAIRERHRRLHQRELHRLRLLHQGLPVQHPARQPDRSQILQMHALLGPGRPSASSRPA